MIQTVLVAALILIGQSTLNKVFPDSIRCGGDNTQYSGATFSIHSTNQTNIIYYCQINHAEERCVGFSTDGGSNIYGLGHYDSRKGC